jgi:hypothetical protein
MNTDIINNALEYYDKNKEIYQKFMNKIKYISFDKGYNEIDHDIITFYDNNKQQIHNTAFEEIGVYASDHKVWTWAWSIPTLRKTQTYIISKILDYGIKLSPDNLFLKTELITSRFKISNKVQLDIHTAVASYLSKSSLVISYIYDPNVPAESLESKLHPFRELKFMEDLSKLPKNSLIYFFYLFDDPLHDKN